MHVDCQLMDYNGIEFLAWCGTIPRLAGIPKMMITCFLINFGSDDLSRLVKKDDPRVLAELEGGTIREVPTPTRYFPKPVATYTYLQAIDKLRGTVPKRRQSTHSAG